MRSIVVAVGLVLMFVFFILGGFISLIWVFTIGLTFPAYVLSVKKNPSVEKLISDSKGDPRLLVKNIFQTDEGKFIVSRLDISKYIDNQGFLKEKHSSDTNIAIKDLYNLSKPKEPKMSHLIFHIAKRYKPLINILKSKELKLDSIYHTARWYEILKKTKDPLIFDLEKIKNLPGVGYDWSYGYTYEFDKYASDVTRRNARYPILFGRERELKEIEKVLSKETENSVIVVGEPGVGRHILIQTLAHRIQTGNCVAALSKKRLLEIDMSKILASQKDPSSSEDLLSTLLKEADSAGNVICLLDEVDKHIGSSSVLDVSGILEKYEESSLSFIGITTPNAYIKNIQKNKTIDKMFEKVEIAPPDNWTVIYELAISVAPFLERKFGITITFRAILKAVEDADKYITQTPFPAKAIELLEEICVYLKSETKMTTVLPYHVDEYLSHKLHISIGQIEKNEKEKLLQLEDILHQYVINQERAISSLSSALRRARLELISINRPRASFLFLGPTGVGKTETAKALARVYFESKERLIRFDMSQFQKEEGLERLIGSVKTGIPGELTSKLYENPFSLLLFDEIEKADSTVLNLLLTLVDEGYITDAQGTKIDGRNTIIISTSNAGSEIIRKKVTEGLSGETLQKDLIDYVLQKRIFSPEFLNRFDGVVVFSPLSEGHLREIARKMLYDLNKRLVPKGVSVDINSDLIERLAYLGFDPAFGARAMRRAIEEKVTDEVVKKLLSQKPKNTQEISKVTINL